MKQKLVSIAMATYNGEKYLRMQLDSILSQTYKNIEIIICDDCSTDGTVKILEEYRKEHGITYYVNERNLGYIKNFEKVLGYCSGEYIALSDQDDIWLNNKIEFLLNNIGDSPLIFSDACLIDHFGEIIAESFYGYQNIITRKYPDQFKYLLFSNFVTGCTSLFKKEIIAKAIPFIDSIPHDWWISLIASSIGNIVEVKLPLVLYRRHSNNAIGAKESKGIKISVKNRKIKILKEIHIPSEIIKALKSRCDEFSKFHNILEIENDLDIYSKSILKKTPLHINAFFIAWKYRKYWNNKYPEFFALTKLIV